MWVDIEVVGHGEGHADIAGGHGDLARIAITVIALDSISGPARVTLTRVMFSIRPELDVKPALGLAVAVVDVKAAAGHRVAVGGVTGVPAPGPVLRLGSSVSSRSTLGPARRTPGTVCPGGVPVAGVPGGGQGPVGGGDTQTPRHPPLLSAGAPLVHRSPARHPVILTTGAVAASEVKPAGTPRVGLRVLTKQILFASIGCQQMELVTRFSHILLLASGQFANEIARIIHLSCTEFCGLTVALLFALVLPLATFHTWTLCWQSGPLKGLANPQSLVIAVGNTGSAHIGRGDLCTGHGTPGLLANTIGLLAIALPLAIKCPLTSCYTGTSRAIRSSD